MAITKRTYKSVMRSLLLKEQALKNKKLFLDNEYTKKLIEEKEV